MAEVERRAKEIRLSPEELAKMIDHALLRPEKSSDSFRNLCREARKYHFHSVCVNPAWVRFCAEELRGSGVKVVATVSFPFGQMTSRMKALEAMEAIENGASEVDMVMNIGAFKEGNYDYVRRDIEAVVKAVGGNVVKVIIEAGYLTDDEVVKACEIVKSSGAHFVKTATGFGPTGATVPHVYLMRRAVGDDFGVKASGGIRSLHDVLLMIAAGANRIGSSSSVRIMEECLSRANE
ncbi:MAG: 2-deoxyribose-5-phosphate aldolase [Candidatus Hadarchaeum yellowstonense]|uniref:Deoxyribose-phosphate aldolase n=1 Tax=Hadarchaeum yellowstonense TaxID=1776334 RepID=A0A147JVD5_HADYE|nr:MAG: 2-deoxyribose-5-phosphate aldolase [Candidatus Hadarchaeum yellowstonense]